MKKALGHFIDMLRHHANRDGIFNPWRQVDKEHDVGRHAPAIRRRQLFQYLMERKSALYLLHGEALGYQGGHFTGIPMTSERILLGGHKSRGILPEHVFSPSALEPRRTSRPDQKRQGFTEPTATIVWEQIVHSGKNPKSFILWNAFPWHPYSPDSGMLSNRTPHSDEIETGDSFLIQLVKMSGVKEILALGEKAQEQAHRLGIDSIKLRHPASGGSAEFRKQFRRLVGRRD